MSDPAPTRLAGHALAWATRPARVDPSDLLEVERPLLAGVLLRERVEELVLGRTLARRLAARLGAPAPFAVLRADDRRPLWPTGWTGSIAHSSTACVVTLARSTDVRALGIDTEPADPLEPALWPWIASTAELERSVAATALAPGVAARALFVVKEAVFKCQFPLTGRFLELEDVTVDRVEPREPDAWTVQASVASVAALRCTLHRVALGDAHHLVALAAV